MTTSFIDFRKKFDDLFLSMNNRNSVAYQLVDTTDLFQKISCLYRFGATHQHSALQNPTIFQVVESALFYGVCMQIRRIADGKQKKEISLFKFVSEIRSNCKNWTRQDFVTWDGLPYDSSQLRIEHEKEVQRIFSESIAAGKSATWLPIGKHEEVDRRHSIFDLLSNTSASKRAVNDICRPKTPDYVLNLLGDSAGDIIDFSNQYLAHRINFSPEREPEFDISLQKIEDSIIALWKCYNILSSIFRDSYMTPDIVHSLNSFNYLEMAVANKEEQKEMIAGYEEIKSRMESIVNRHSREWKSKFIISSNRS